MFRADIAGKTLTCDLNGLIGSNFVMRDRQTGSDWQQATGEAIAGPMKGKRLTMVPFLLTTWGEWRAQHRETLALVPEPRYQAQYQLMARRVANLLRSSAPREAPLRDDPRLPPHEQVLGLETGGGHKAYPLALLQKQTVLNDQVGSTPVLVIHAAASNTTTAFSRIVRDRTLTFQVVSLGAVEVMDRETGSKWTPYGECIAGELKGEKLDAITPLPSFWFSWAEFFPDTEVFTATAN